MELAFLSIAIISFLDILGGEDVAIVIDFFYLIDESK
jgi:hypothetical protein